MSFYWKCCARLGCAVPCCAALRCAALTGTYIWALKPTDVAICAKSIAVVILKWNNPMFCRSRSPSNQHRRRRHRSPSRSRSPEHTHNGSRRRETSAARSSQAEAPNLLNMSYDEYLEYFERMRKQRGAAAGPPAPAPPAGPPPPQQARCQHTHHDKI